MTTATTSSVPDFEQIARELAPAIGPEEPFPYRNTVAAIAEQLRQVWNARGAADIAKVEAACDVATESGYRSLKELIPEVQGLDR